QLAKAIGSGDLSDAQQAYATLTQTQGNTPGSNANSPFGQALTQIGQALQNGDLAGAQKALDALRSQTQGAHHHHHHGGHHSSGGESTAATPPTSSNSGASTNVDVTA